MCVCFGIGATIRIGQEIQCLPYAEFFNIFFVLVTFVLVQYLRLCDICILLAFAFKQHLPFNNICDLVIFVFWQHLRFGNIFLLAPLASWCQLHF